jgi:5-(carboxyamino)imidazole ribonucleotide synthase
MHVKTIGIVGGGQLGRMLTLAAKPLGFEVLVLDPNIDCPAAQVGATVLQGDLYDEASIKALAEKADVVTIEIEHLNTDALIVVEESGTPVYPSPATIKMIQDKYKQKLFLDSKNIAVAKSVEVLDKKTAQVALKDFSGKLILKTKHGAYDGRGNAVVKSSNELEDAWRVLGGNELYAEELLDFEKELSVIIARDVSGEVKVYDVVEMHHERSICVEVNYPAQITKHAKSQAVKLAESVSELLEGAGVFAIEMFLLKDGSVLVNEIAPRVHNSGHHTIEACITSQFEQHIRAISGLPLGDVSPLKPAATMVNILGESNGSPSLDLSSALSQENVHIHWYGKSPVKIDRKMGHITALGDNLELVRKRASKARRQLKI